MAPNVVTYIVPFSACGKGRQQETAMQVFAAMVKQCMVPNAIAYSSLISACEKGKQPETVIKVFAAM